MSSNSVILPRTAQKAARLLAETEMRPFTEVEREIFSGTESKDPLYGDHKSGTIVLVDGDRIEFVDEYGNFATFRVVKC